MARKLPIPFFGTPPAQYDRGYFAQLIRSFSVFAEQVRTPGPERATTITLTDLPVFPNNADALTGGLVAGDVYRTAAGELRIVV